MPSFDLRAARSGRSSAHGFEPWARRSVEHAESTCGRSAVAPRPVGTAGRAGTTADGAGADR